MGRSRPFSQTLYTGATDAGTFNRRESSLIAIPKRGTDLSKATDGELCNLVLIMSRRCPKKCCLDQRRVNPCPRSFPLEENNHSYQTLKRKCMTSPSRTR